MTASPEPRPEPTAAAEAPAVIYLPDLSQPAAQPQPQRMPGRRARVPDPRTDFVAVRCTPAEYATITAAAAQRGLTVGAYLRALGTGSAGVRARRSAPADHAVLVALLAELGKIGSNHNQLAHAFNAIGEVPDDARWHSQDQAIQEMRRGLLKALGHGD